MNGQGPTLADVARRVGVSATTVSRTLSGSQLVNTETAKRVRRVAAEMGYVPHAGARGLRTRRTMTVGVVFPDLASPVLVGSLEGLFEGLQARGYTPLATTSANNIDNARELLRHFLERRVDGVVLQTPQGVGAMAGQLMDAGIPVIASGMRGDGCGGIPLVEVATARLAEEAVHALADLGHRRFGILTSEPARWGTAQELEEEVLRRGLTPVVHYYPRGSREEEAVVRGLADLLARGSESPTVLFVAYRNVNLVLSELAARGVGTPQDVSLVTLANVERHQSLLALPISAVVHLDARDLGRDVAQVLTEWMEGGHAPPDVVSVNIGRWHPTASIGPAPR